MQNCGIAEKHVDKPLETCNLVTLLPWVGDNFGTGGVFGGKLLVLGESVYEKKEGTRERVPEMVRMVINNQTGGCRWSRFYARIHEVVGSDHSLPDFWHSVAFYNFVQKPVGKSYSERPKDEDWQNSKEPMAEVVKMLAPQAVFVLGKTLWYRLIGLDLVSATNAEHGTLTGFASEAAWMYHPSWRGISAANLAKGKTTGKTLLDRLVKKGV